MMKYILNMYHISIFYMRYCMQYTCKNKQKSKHQLICTSPKVWRMFPASSIETVFKVLCANVLSCYRDVSESAKDCSIFLAFCFKLARLASPPHHSLAVFSELAPVLRHCCPTGIWVSTTLHVLWAKTVLAYSKYISKVNMCYLQLYDLYDVYT